MEVMMKKLMVKLCIVLALQAVFVGHVCSMNAGERPLKNAKWKEKNQHEAIPARFCPDIVDAFRDACADNYVNGVRALLRCYSFMHLDISTKKMVIEEAMKGRTYKTAINNILLDYLRKLEAAPQQVKRRKNNRQNQETKRPMVVQAIQDDGKLPAVKPIVQHQPTHQFRHNACLPNNVRLDRVTQRLTALRLEIDQELAQGHERLQQRLRDDKEMIAADTRQGEMGKDIEKLEAAAGLYEDGVQDVEMRKDLQTLEADAGVHEDNYEDDFE